MFEGDQQGRPRVAAVIAALVVVLFFQKTKVADDTGPRNDRHPARRKTWVGRSRRWPPVVVSSKLGVQFTLSLVASRPCRW